MRPNIPSNTESTFSNNEEVNRLAGQSNVNVGKQRNITVSLYDVDFAIKWHIENIIAPTIIEDGNVLPVPVLFSNGEKWAAVQKHGYLRDNQGKLLTPLIMIKRNAITKREDIPDIKVLETPEARLIFERKYTSQNRYDRFSAGLGKRTRELYSIDVPKFVQIEYELLCWTNNTSQLNSLIEQLVWFDGKAFGDTYKFNTYIDTPSFETMNNVGEDRVIRATLPMRTKAYILNAQGPYAPIMYKLNPVSKIIIGAESEMTMSDTSAIRQAGTSTSTGAGRATSGNSINFSVITYLNSNYQLTGTVINSSTVIFPSEWMSAPSPLTATSIDNFTFFVNGQMIERSAITSFVEIPGSGTSRLIVNTKALGFSLSELDEVIGIGKFINKDSVA